MISMVSLKGRYVNQWLTSLSLDMVTKSVNLLDFLVFKSNNLNIILDCENFQMILSSLKPS